MSKPLIVKPVEGPLEHDCYYVESSRGPGFWHKVDLSENREDYGCGCEDFYLVLYKAVEADKPLFVKGITACKHQMAAIEYKQSMEGKE